MPSASLLLSLHRRCTAQRRKVHSKNKTPVLGYDIPVLGVKLNRGSTYFGNSSTCTNVYQCSATLMEISRRDLLNDMAEYRPNLNNKQNTYYPRFTFSPKTGKELPKTGVSSLCRKREQKKNQSLLGYLNSGEEYQFLKTLSFNRAQRTTKNPTNRKPIRSSDRYKIEFEIVSDVSTQTTLV